MALSATVTKVICSRILSKNGTSVQEREGPRKGGRDGKTLGIGFVAGFVACISFGHGTG